MVRVSFPRLSSILALLALPFLLASPALADGEPAPSQEEAESNKAFKSIEWTKGPAKVQVGNQGQLQVPAGYAFTSSAGAQKLLQLLHNPTGGSELGILTDDKLEWFLLFEFEDIGYVKDADKEKLDAADMLKSIREGNESSNEARKEKGWAPITIVGWHTPPFYNKDTHNLEWCIEGESRGHKIINYNTRILGRGGVMSANLLVGPEELNQTLPLTKKILSGYAFTSGKRYGEWRSGDKIAKYGLSALVVGGAVGLAAKMGILAKLGGLLAKAGKALIVAVLALGAALKRLFTRKPKNEPAPADLGPPPQG